MMTPDEIPAWRRIKLKRPDGSWKLCAIDLVFDEMQICSPVLWLERAKTDIANVKQCAAVYEKLVRLAGEILNQHPDEENARRLMNMVCRDFDYFKKGFEAIKGPTLFQGDMLAAVIRCYRLANDTYVRIKVV